MIYDIAVVGGGAAGMFAAIIAKKQNKNLNIVVIEALSRVGKKLITTGNGQCNITNKNACSNFYFSEDKKEIDSVFSRFSVDDTVKVFEEIGVNIVFEEDGRAYPASYQAGSVVDAMRFALEELSIDVLTDTKITSFKRKENYILVSEDKIIESKKVIFAAGGLSGGAKLGSFGDVLRMFKDLGYKTSKTTPSLVQIKTETELVKQLKGIKFLGNATVKVNGKSLKTESGEILFTDYGLSGPAILGVSRAAARENGMITICLDILPDIDLNALENYLLKRRNYLKERLSGEFLTGFINKRLGQVLMKTVGIDLNVKVSGINDSDIKKLAQIIKSFDFLVTGCTGFNNSQVTAGGIKLSEINTQTFESVRHKNLYIIGEILDVDGECGGFNLQWAWSSAAIAAKNASKVL